MERTEKLLALILRLAACTLLLAWPWVFIPSDVMAAGHRALGMGEFPASTVLEYMIRTASVLYGSRGIVYLMLATDVRRYRPLVRGFGVLDFVAGVLILGIDLVAGMPWFWTWFEGPGVAAFGVVLWVMGGKVGPWTGAAERAPEAA